MKSNVTPLNPKRVVWRACPECYCTMSQRDIQSGKRDTCPSCGQKHVNTFTVAKVSR